MRRKKKKRKQRQLKITFIKQQTTYKKYTVKIENGKEITRIGGGGYGFGTFCFLKKAVLSWTNKQIIFF